MLSDNDILSAGKITTQMAADYLGIPRMAVCCGMRPYPDKSGNLKQRIPIGNAVKRGRWSYYIVPERLIAYKHGKLVDCDIAEIQSQILSLSQKLIELQQDMA